MKKIISVVERRLEKVTNAPNTPFWATIFMSCYLAALSIHYTTWLKEPLIAAVMVTCLIVSFLKPGNILPFIIANIVAFYHDFGNYPDIANHAVLQLMIAGFSITLFLFAFVTNKEIGWNCFKNGLRGAAIVLYFYVGFHKINSGFLDPEISCATWYHQRFSDYYLGIENVYEVYSLWFLQMSAWAVIVLELAAVILLLIPRTWVLGLLLAFPIHFYVSFTAFADFSSMMHAIMLLFLPMAFWERIQQNQSIQKMFFRAYTAYHAVILLLFIVPTFIMFGFFFHKEHEIYELLGITHWMVPQGIFYNIGVLILALTCLYILIRPNNIMFAAQRSEWQFKTYHLIFPALLLMWGFLPYLGLSSRLSFTMFSNLVTHQNYQNHYLINTSHTKLMNWEEEKLYIENVEGYRRVNKQRTYLNQRYIPEIQLRRIATHGRERDFNPKEVNILKNGTQHYTGNLYESPYAYDIPGWAGWTTFRYIDPNKPDKCLW